MVKAIEASKQIVQTGTQQRSWDHWVLGKQIIDSGRLGQITFVQTYWYQHATAGNYAAVSMDKLDWKRWLGPAPDQPFRPERFYQWRHFWDFGGGQRDRPDDALDRRGPLVHGRRRAAVGGRHRAQLQPQAVGSARHRQRRRSSSRRTSWRSYLGTYVSRVDDGGLEFRGDKGTLKIDRARLAFYRDDAAYAPGTLAPEPDIYVRSSGDGTLTHLQNWLDCIRSRKAPNAHIRVGHQAARTSHLANAALRAGHLVRWNNAAEKIEADRSAGSWRRRSSAA